jgi:major membrane immunogen (membrane-anchored lipoprotein)
MKKSILTFVMALIGVIAYSQNVTYVNGYFKSNGTFVQGHYRTEANTTVTDNWSTIGNINPYTGEIGTKVIADYSNYNSNYIHYESSYNKPSVIMQTNPINYTNDVMKTNSINYTNDIMKTNNLFR